MRPVMYKFGGTSVGSHENLEHVIDIIQSDPRKKAIVFSAPGGVTKMLKNGIATTKEGLFNQAYAKQVLNRFKELYSEIPSIASTYQDEMDILQRSFKRSIGSFPDEDAFTAFMLSRGEATNITLITEYLKYKGVNIKTPKTHPFWSHSKDAYTDASISMDSKERVLKAMKGSTNTAFMGYVVLDPTDETEYKVIGDDGSNMTAAIGAVLIDASAYYNFTDVDGVKPIDPRLLPENERESVKSIDKLNYLQAQQLTAQGEGLFMPAGIDPLRKNNISLYIKKTTEPKKPGTVIERYESMSPGIVAVSGSKRVFRSLNVHTEDMRKKPGYFSKVSNQFEQVSLESMPTTAVDIEATFLNKEGLDLDPIKQRLSEIGEVTERDGERLISLIGSGFEHNPALTGAIHILMQQHGIPVRIWQQSKDYNAWFTVPKGYANKAKVEIYRNLDRINNFIYDPKF